MAGIRAQRRRNGTFKKLPRQVYVGSEMGGKVSTTGRLYVTGGHTVFVSSPNSCPRINIAESSVRLRDDFSKGFKAGKIIAKKAITC